MEKVITDTTTKLKQFMILPIVLYPTYAFINLYISHREFLVQTFLLHYLFFNVLALLIFYAESFTKSTEIYFSTDFLVFKPKEGEQTVFRWDEISTTLEEREAIFYKAMLIPVRSRNNPEIIKVILVTAANIKSLVTLAEKYSPKNNCLLISIKATEKKYK